MRRLFVIVAAGLLTLGAFLRAGTAQAAVDRFLESIDYASENGYAVIKINLGERVTYIKHFPEKRGNTLEIQLQTFSVDSSAPQPQFDREVLLAPYSKLIPLAGVTQESTDVMKPTLTVRFSRTVNFEVSVTPGKQTIVIQLPGITYSETGKSQTTENRRISAMEDVSIADTAEQARRLVEDARASFKAGDYAGAMMKSGQALNLPDHPYRNEAEAVFVDARRAQQKGPPTAAPAREKEQEKHKEKPAAELPPLEEDDEGAQLAQAREAMKAGQWEAAVRVLTLLSDMASPSTAKQASELLEQARNKQKPGDARPAKPGVAAKEKAPSAADEQARGLLKRANDAMAAGELAAAIKLYGQIIALPPNAHTTEAERMMRTARGAQSQSENEDLTGLVIGDPQTLDDVRRMMDEGQTALRRGDNNRAIVIYGKIVSLPEHELMPDAMEFLGVARQRNNQVARAKAIYEDYIKKYPSGDGTDRVRQRLAEIVAASLSPKQAPRDRDGKKDDKTRVDKFISWAQTYNWGVREVPVVEEGDVSTPQQPGQATTTRQDQSVLISYLAGNMRMRSSRYDIRSVFNGTHQKNFLVNDNKDRFLVNQAYVDFNDREKHYQIKAGRQSGTISGTLGRFDGIMAGYDLKPKFRVNGAFGFPVDLAHKDTINFDSVMYVGNFQFKDVLPQLDVIPFVSVQTIDKGELDRAAIGEEVRYFNQRGTLFHVLDYDTLYQALNLIYVQGQLNLSTSSALYSSFDYRATPFYSLNTALYNQSATGTGSAWVNACGHDPSDVPASLAELRSCYSTDEIRNLSADQTSYATSLVLGVNHNFSEKYQVSGDVTWASQSYAAAQLDASPDLPDSESTMTYGARLTTIGVVWEREITIFSLTFTNASSYDETQFLFQNRAPFLEGWRLDTEFRTNLRSDSSGQETRRLRPAIGLVYDARGKWSLETQIGAEFSHYSNFPTTNSSQLTDETRYFGTIGYRLNF